MWDCSSQPFTEEETLRQPTNKGTDIGSDN